MSIGRHLLGRIPPPDTKHLELYPFTALVTPPQGIEVEITRPTLSLYDQGQTPRCVAYSTSRVINWLNKYAFDADWLYAQCKLIDGYPGDGTNARAACDVLRSKGHWRTINGVDVKVGPRLQHGIASNTWAMSVDAIRSVFARPKPQPVLIGIDWYEAWFNPTQSKGTPDYWLQDPYQSGGIAGGHEIGIWACSDNRQAFGLSNTWGSGWPPLVWMPYTTMTHLFSGGADACIINDLITR